MNITTTSIKSISSKDDIRLVEFTNNLVMIRLGFDFEIDSTKMLEIAFSPTSVIVAKEFSGETSISNVFEATINNITQGEILTTLALSSTIGEIESIITTKSTQKLNLKVGQMVSCLIKASDISIVKVLP